MDCLRKTDAPGAKPAKMAKSKGKLGLEAGMPLAAGFMRWFYDVTEGQ